MSDLTQDELSYYKALCDVSNAPWSRETVVKLITEVERLRALVTVGNVPLMREADDLQSRLTAAEKERDTIKMQEAASKVVINCALDDLRKLTGNTNGCLASEIKCVAKRLTAAETRVKECRKALARISDYPLNSEAVGVAMDMAHIACEALKL